MGRVLSKLCERSVTGMGPYGSNHRGRLGGRMRSRTKRIVRDDRLG